ncbi:MAG: hypothetical protein PHV74_01705 [Dehalococcoidia bacterium]|nr:hypothetical protein [Dehalococcoidia bacterium]
MEFDQKLLEPGWAGDLSPEELAFIKGKLKSDRRLRARWGMPRGTGKVNDEKIRLVAIGGTNSPELSSHKPVEGVFHARRNLEQPSPCTIHQLALV